MLERLAISVVGLAFGDCGKGSIVNFLVGQHAAHTVVRFNGGPQAGHNVVTTDGREHTFSQFGSGTFVNGTRTLLSRFMLIEPYAIFNEARHLETLGITDAMDRLMIDRRCTVITPAHQAANRIREIARGAAAHGTCGVGAGETVQDGIDHPELTIFAGDLMDHRLIVKKLRAIRDLKWSQLGDVILSGRINALAERDIRTLTDTSWMEVAADNYRELGRRVAIVDEAGVRNVLRASGALIMEGAQGVLLDESFGFLPHTTWSDTTFANADSLLNEAAHDGTRMRVGVLRSYFTRHGAGPFVTEDHSMSPGLHEPHNSGSGWQGRFRVGTFDAVAARYALAVTGGVDLLALTHLDRLPQLPRRICTAYQSDVLHDGFVRKEEQIVNLRVKRGNDMLTPALNKCRPIFTDYGNGAACFIDAVSQNIQAPVGIASFGPTAADKRILPSIRR